MNSGFSRLPRPEQDVVLYGGRILTCNPRQPEAEALWVHGERIAAVGPLDGMPAGARRVNLDGRTVVPGFNDCHNHQLYTGLNLGKVQLAGASSIADVQRIFATAAARTPKGLWLVASGGWHETNLAEGRLPTRQELDLVTPEHPVFIPRGVHVAVANSLALRLAGIADSAPDPPGGSYGRDEAGRLNGIMIEPAAFGPVARLLPPPGLPERLAALDKVGQLYAAAGITSVRDPGLTPEEMAAYQAAYERGLLRTRTNLLLGARPGEGVEALCERLLSLGARTGFGDAHLRLGGVKVFLDGGIEGAYLREPYLPGNPGYRGHLLFARDDLVALARFCVQHGWHLGAHVVGDAALDMAVDALWEVHRETPLKGRGFCLEHCFLTDPAHYPRLRAMGITITAEFPLVYNLAGNMLLYWGRERSERAVPIREWLDAGLAVAGGSDSFIGDYEPLKAIWACVTRQTRRAGALGRQHAISREEALFLYTAAGARVTGEGDLKGMLAPGMLADLVVLDGDFLTCDADAIKDLRVSLTVCGGQATYNPSQLWPGE